MGEAARSGVRSFQETSEPVGATERGFVPFGNLSVQCVLQIIMADLA